MTQEQEERRCPLIETWDDCPHSTEAIETCEAEGVACPFRIPQHTDEEYKTGELRIAALEKERDELKAELNEANGQYFDLDKINEDLKARIKELEARK